jgi:glycosyltransferase involved in cell wall biosynthesis
MDVGQVTHRYRPSVGGIENYVHRLNGSLRERGHGVSTFTTDASLDGGGTPVEDERVVYGKTVAAPLRNPFSVDLYRAVRDSDCDLYHLHNLWFLATVAAARAVADRPTVLTVHSAAIANRTPLVRALNAAYRPLAQYVLDRVDHSFVQGETERRRLLDTFDVDPASVSVVPNGIHPETCDVPDRVVDAFRRERGLDPDVPTLLYVSRLVPEKNPGVLLDALDYLDGVPLQVLVVGDGDPEFVASLRARADERVAFLSGLARERLLAAYHAADLFAFLGSWEGLPTVILEAMNARLPVISTPVGAVPDAVRQPENGRLLDSPPTPEAVATSVRYYLDRPDTRRAVGERNRRRVRSEYAWDGVAADIAEQYDRLV